MQAAGSEGWTQEPRGESAREFRIQSFRIHPTISACVVAAGNRNLANNQCSCGNVGQNLMHCMK